MHRAEGRVTGGVFFLRKKQKGREGKEERS